MPKPEQELILKPQAKKEKLKEIQPELTDFPESIQELFNQLPDGIKAKIFPKEPQPEFKKPSWLWKTPEEELDETIASLDRKDCERYAGICFENLFFTSPEFKHLFENTDAQTIGPIITNLLDTLWNNRGKDKSKIQIVNQQRFDDYRSQNSKLNQQYQELTEKIKALEKNIEQTKHQKRFTATKKQELYQLHEQRNHLKSNFGNTSVSPLESRYKETKEKKWTEALTTAIEYLDSFDFTVLASENIERSFYRYKKIIAQKGKTAYGQELPPERVKDAQEFLAAANQAFENWQKQHSQEGPLKKFQPGNLAEKQDKLINYFKALAGSYERMKKEGRTEDDQLMNIRQMEVTLNLLSKSEK